MYPQTLEPDGALGAADEELAPAETLAPEADDDTGICIESFARVPGARGPADRFRIGFVSLPTRPFSCALAVMIHLLALSAAAVATRWFYSPPQQHVTWGSGGTQSQTASKGDDLASSLLPALPTPPVSLPAPAHTPDAGSPDQHVADPSFASMRVTRVFDGAHDPSREEPDENNPLIGLAERVDMSRPPLRADRQGPQIAAPTGDRGNGAARSAAAGKNGSATHAALPAALGAKGIPAPDYPAEAQRRGQQGLVKVSLEVLPNGSLGEVRIVSDPGYPLLRQAALSAVERLRQYPFTPARKFGRPIRDWLVIPYRFILN